MNASTASPSAVPSGVPSTARLVRNPRGPGLPGGAFPGWGPKLGCL
jgi:hypothetical protein